MFHKVVDLPASTAKKLLNPPENQGNTRRKRWARQSRDALPC
jgi:hypothetical protein